MAPPAHATVRTLVVDDDPSMRVVSRMILERTGRFKIVAEAADGAEGIERASEHQPDLVLLDITMPGMDGFEALPHIRAAAPAARVVVLTGLSAHEVRDKVMGLGAHGFLEKDPNPDSFLSNLFEIIADDDPLHEADRSTSRRNPSS